MQRYIQLTIAFTLSICMLLPGLRSDAQTTLVKGDIAFTGYLGNGATAAIDEFSFVLLRNIAAGTLIKFTENGWLRTSSTTGSFRTGEGTLLFSSLALNAGTEIRIVCSTTPTATYGPTASTAGSVSILAAPEGNSASLALSATGDQIIAYQGASTSPTFITAIHMNVYSVAANPVPGIPGSDPVTTTTVDWDGSLSNGNASGLPSGTGSNFLTTGVDAIWIPGTIAPEVHNAKFTCAGPLSTIAEIRSRVFNVANWITSNGAATFTLPAFCPFFSTTVPVKLLDFTVKALPGGNELKWSTTDQVNFSRFELQRQAGIGNFETIRIIPAISRTGEIQYTFLDNDMLTRNQLVFYRLRMVDDNGSYSYSGTVSAQNNYATDLLIIDAVQPVSRQVPQINFSIVSSKRQTVSIRMTDVKGVQMFEMQSKLTTGKNLITIPNRVVVGGIYFLVIGNEMGERFVRKLIVQ